jgi:hypothetical protein
MARLRIAFACLAKWILAAAVSLLRHPQLFVRPSSNRCPVTKQSVLQSHLHSQSACLCGLLPTEPARAITVRRPNFLPRMFVGSLIAVLDGLFAIALWSAFAAVQNERR